MILSADLCAQTRFAIAIAAIAAMGLGFPKCEICTKPFTAFLAFAAFSAYYQSIRVLYGRNMLRPYPPPLFPSLLLRRGARGEVLPQASNKVLFPSPGQKGRGASYQQRTTKNLLHGKHGGGRPHDIAANLAPLSVTTERGWG